MLMCLEIQSFLGKIGMQMTKEYKEGRRRYKHTESPMQFIRMQKKIKYNKNFRCFCNIQAGIGD